MVLTKDYFTKTNQLMKIQLTKNQKVFTTSDTHYNHTNIVDSVSQWKDTRSGETRDFKSLYHMNQTIVNNINDVVGIDDILVHLGDWSFGGVESIWEFRKQINCKNIHLIFGNHDEHIINNKLIPDSYQPSIGRSLYSQELFTSCGFYEEFELLYPQIQKNIKIQKLKFVASHYPMASWNGLGKGRIMLHGHLHLNSGRKIHQGKSMDVGVDGNSYKPYLINDIFSLMEKQPINNTILLKDHHVS